MGYLALEVPHAGGAVQRALTLSVGPAQAVAHQTPAVFVFDGVSGEGWTRPVPSHVGTDLVAVLDAPGGSRLQSIAALLPGWGLAVDGATERLFVPDIATDRVDLFDAVHGRYLRSVRVGALAVAVALDPRTRRAFLASMGPASPARQASSVSVLDSASGRVLRTVAVGAYPTLVAVDAAAGRVLVVHGWGGMGAAGESSQGIGDAGTDVLDARSGRLVDMVASDIPSYGHDGAGQASPWVSRRFRSTTPTFDVAPRLHRVGRLGATGRASSRGARVLPPRPIPHQQGNDTRSGAGRHQPTARMRSTPSVRRTSKQTGSVRIQPPCGPAG
jgi:hypothetical protein